MAGDPLTDIASWRLTTAGGIPYRQVSLTGGVGETDSSAVLVAIIQSQQLYPLALELFPPPIISAGGPVYPIPLQLGGSVTLDGYKFGIPLYAKKMDWKIWGDLGMPVDPFENDNPAPGTTYYGFLEVSITFEPLRITSPTQDPKDLIEISGSDATTNINVRLPKAQLPHGTDYTSPERFGVIRVSQESWKLKFPLVNATFAQQFLGTMRALKGYVNNANFNFTGNNPPGTLLFSGWDYEEKWTWSHSQLESPPVQLTLKFEEKVVPAVGGGIGGWNHFYNEDPDLGAVGFDLLDMDGNNTPLFPSGDFSQLIPF